MSCLTSVGSQYVYIVRGISNPFRWSPMDSKWWAISTKLTQCNITTEQKSVLKRIRLFWNHLSYLLLRAGANISVGVNIIHPMHCTCSHWHTPTYAHNKIVSYTKTWTLLHVSVINHCPQGDVSKKEFSHSIICCMQDTSIHATVTWSFWIKHIDILCLCTYNNMYYKGQFSQELVNIVLALVFPCSWSLPEGDDLSLKCRRVQVYV
jgi:hypothetical protein